MANTKSNNEKQPKRITYATPKGRALFVHVVSPDYGTDKFPLAEGQFSLSLILGADESAVLKERLEGELEKAREYADEKFMELKRVTREKLGKVTFNPICEPVYDENDEPTGEYRWRFKTNAFVADKNSNGKKRKRVIPLFDTLNQPVHLKEEPGNGSVVRVSFTCNPYFVEGQGMGGLSLYLNAVQIVKLVKFGERDAASYGFTVDEDEADGFKAADARDDEAEDFDEEDTHERRKGRASAGPSEDEDDIPEDVAF